MRLRALTRADLERVRQLRNANRDAFFDDREISAEDQQRWFERLSQRPILFYVIEIDDAVVGTISVLEHPAGREIGNLLLDSGYRGRGIMTQAIDQLTAKPGSYFAEVKPKNEASLRVFAACGFEASIVRVSKQVP